MTHQCSLPLCDGTALGHVLARDHAKETATLLDRLDRLANPDDHVRPENLQVDPTPSQGAEE